MADVDFTPLWHWVVRYSYLVSRWDLWRRFTTVCFWTYKEAQAFANAEHPEILGFKVESVYEEAIPRLKHAGCSPSYYGQNTDEQILGY